MVKGFKTYSVIMGLMMALLLSGCKTEHRFIKKVAFKGDDSIAVTFAAPVDDG